jgi:hypothetical protein
MESSGHGARTGGVSSTFQLILLPQIFAYGGQWLQRGNLSPQRHRVHGVTAWSSLIPGWLVLFLCRVHIIHQIRIFSPSSSRGGFCFGFALGCEFCGPALFRGRFFPGLDRILGHALNSPPYGRSVLSILSGRARMMPLLRTAALRTHPDHA